jgi:(E)-4-hydroxy-3-methyl-but-2-enyl pyrophosphate reductase
VEAAGDTSRPVLTHGQLIHNTHTVEKLRDEHGIRHVDSHEAAPKGSALVIRAHGVPPQLKRTAEESGLDVIDGTCPLVDIIHRKARKLLSEGYDVVVIGKATHPEIIGIVGAVRDAGGEALVLETIEDAEALPLQNRVGIVVQSTLVAAKAGKIAAVLVPKSKEVRVLNTICHVTTERQEEARGLSDSADVILVVGSPHSSNTRKLTEVCSMDGTETHMVETVADIDLAWFEGKHHVGIHAGASTPVVIIDEIVAFLAGRLSA